MSDTRREFRWFWAWNDEKEEAWLSEMARQGWHLQSPGAFGFYTFERGERRNDVYRLDYKSMGKDMSEYLQLFSDAGWEHLGSMGGWQYFRTAAAEGETPEIYTDNASKIQKYYRLLSYLIVFLPIYTVILTRDVRSGYMQVVKLVLTLFLILYAYAIVRIFTRILQLRK